jgi:signal transduction histidine kinase
LENYDNTWSAPSKSGSAIYANLAPGNYVFHVKASYDGFNWNDRSTSYALIIAPPFWKTWWFYAIVVSFVLAGFIMFNNYRIKIKINQLIAIEKLKKEEFSRIQKKVAMDFHDEVGNHLTSISLLVELIKSNEWKIDRELRELLDKIDDESKNLFRGTRDFIWSIDPANDNLMAVYQNIHDYAIDLFENSSISFHPDNGTADMFKVKLPAGFTRHIVLIFKEGLNNVLNHAGCRNVYFSISIDGKNIELKLRDDGKGFCEKDLHQIEGIKKMKYRGAKIRSELILNSDESMGTEIILKARV